MRVPPGGEVTVVVRPGEIRRHLVRRALEQLVARDGREAVLLALELPREGTQSAAIRTTDADPRPGDSTAAVCELTGAGEPRPLTLEVLDPYAPGGYPAKLVQRVEVDGAEVFFPLDICYRRPPPEQDFMPALKLSTGCAAGTTIASAALHLQGLPFAQRAHQGGGAYSAPSPCGLIQPEGICALSPGLAGRADRGGGRGNRAAVWRQPGQGLRSPFSGDQS